MHNKSKRLWATQLGKWIVCKQWLTVLMPPTSGFNPKVELKWKTTDIVKKQCKRQWQESTGGDVTLLKTFTKLSVRETELSLPSLSERPRKVPHVHPITRASNNTYFHTSLIFVLYFQSQFQRFFPLFVAFSHLRSSESLCHKDHVSSALFGGVSTWMGDQIRIPRSNNLFFPFFSLPFSKAILKTADLPSLRNIVSSLYQLFILRFAMAFFMCIHLRYRIYKQRDTSFELSSILWTVDLSEHLITAWIFQKFIQLNNFVTFSVFFFFFGNRVRLKLYERALSCFREMRLL